jgi:tetratricopeptide (TPR) repeat protein
MITLIKRIFQRKPSINNSISISHIKENSTVNISLGESQQPTTQIDTKTYVEGNVNGGNVAGHDINQVQGNNTTVNITGSTIGESVVTAEQVSGSFNKTEIHHHYPEKIEESISYQPKISSNLPPLTNCFVGRSAQLEQLNSALNSRDISISCIIAAGGIGKTTLIQKWLSDLNKTDYKIFAWSFYNQGANNDSQTSSTPFFSEAFKFFDYQSQTIIDEQERGRELAKLIQQQATIIVLDGLEPLQHSQQADNGFLKDPAIDAFLTNILNAKLSEKSLVLISTRQPLTCFIGKKGYDSIDLLKLNEPDAVQLLKNLGVTKGLEKEFIEAVNFYGCHALALMLLGRMVVNFFEEDIRYYREIPLLEEECEGKHAENILNFYVNRWQDNEPEKLFLYLLGLFDRPMNEDERNELFEKAIIAKSLAALNPLQLKQTIKRLRDLSLLTNDKEHYDCHPIIRNYFGLKFKENYPEDFKQAHLVLFEYFQKMPEKVFGKYLPDTLDEMLPLYRAVVHGCLAWKHQQALNEIYVKRILRGDEHYSWHKLGAYSQGLTVLTAFFPEEGWGAVAVSNEELFGLGSWLLSEVSFCLMSLGRLHEAIEPRKKSINTAVKLKDWINATQANNNLTFLYLVLGKLGDAEKVAKTAMNYAQLSSTERNNLFHPEFFPSHRRRIESYGYLASVLHYLGRTKEAIQYFQEAERLQKQIETNFYYLYSISGSSYCAFLLDTAHDKNDIERILDRGKKFFEWRESGDFLLDIAFDHLTLARTYEALQHTKNATTEFNSALQVVIAAGLVVEYPKFYLYRADFYLTQNQLNPALADLNSAWEIIKRCDMNLYNVDYCLIHGRYSLALPIPDFETALKHYEKAKQLITDTGYHLRDAELDLFAAKLRQQCGEDYRNANQGLYSQTADDYLQKAKNRITEIGQWGLMRVIERDFPV